MGLKHWGYVSVIGICHQGELLLHSLLSLDLHDRSRVRFRQLVDCNYLHCLSTITSLDRRSLSNNNSWGIVPTEMNRLWVSAPGSDGTATSMRPSLGQAMHASHSKGWGICLEHISNIFTRDRRTSPLASRDSTPMTEVIG